VAVALPSVMAVVEEVFVFSMSCAADSAPASAAICARRWATASSATSITSAVIANSVVMAIRTMISDWPDSSRARRRRAAQRLMSVTRMLSLSAHRPTNLTSLDGDLIARAFRTADMAGADEAAAMERDSAGSSRVIHIKHGWFGG
jgi:hypothetical protein